MKALITGANSGIGRDMARYLAKKGVFIYAVGRDTERLNELKEELKDKCDVLSLDLSKRENVFKLYENLKDSEIDIVINNAGFGIFGGFDETSLETELELIDTNIVALHILTKLFYRDFIKKNKGYILNVASSAGFMAGPLLSSYYASKNYVLQLSKAIYEETRRKKKNVSISIFCPGPVKTRFNERANVKFAIGGIESEYAAKYAIDKMFKRRLIIIPTLLMKTGIFLLRFISYKTALKIDWYFQRRKTNKK